MEAYVIHPMVVHFPIVLLLGATLLLGLLALGKPVERLTFWVLGTGVASAWLGLYTGSLAEDHAEDVWHVPEQVIENHERGGQITLALFLLAFVLLWVSRYRLPRLWRTTALAVAVAGSAALVYTGHEGGEIVYEYALSAASDAAATGVSHDHEH
jgi:uncharacterized membrane protein